MGRNRAIKSPLRFLDAESVSREAIIESRARESHAPPVSVYRWWARRTLAVVGGVIDAVAKDRGTSSMLVCDPFAGGGTVALASTLRGHRVYLQDVNPWATNGLSHMLSTPSRDVIDAARDELHDVMKETLVSAYETRMSDGTKGEIVHTLRVAISRCPSCTKMMRLFPYALVSLGNRVERGSSEGWLACRRGHLFLANPTRNWCICPRCRERVNPQASYAVNRRFTCSECTQVHELAALAGGKKLRWEPILVERANSTLREIGLPTKGELEKARDATWKPSRLLGPIPKGHETVVLRRHGFTDWQDCYPARQRVVIEEMLALVARLKVNQDVRSAIRLAVLGATEMAGLISRWDRRYLKSYEGMAGHRFNLTTLSCEPNVWGVEGFGRGTVRRRLNALGRASEWLQGRKMDIQVEGPLTTDRRRSRMPAGIDARIVCGSSEKLLLSDDSADLIWTDPPYHDDVRYGELSGPLRAWAGQRKRLVGEATATTIQDAEYEARLTRIFKECHRVLKSDGHLMLTYANREPQAWLSLFKALHKARFQACGFQVVHAENETDHAKRGVRACTLDIVFDLVPVHRRRPVELFRPKAAPSTDQEKFMFAVGDAFLERVQPTRTIVSEGFIETFSGMDFLNNTPAAATGLS